MARIRTTKPEFWADEKLGPLSPLTRLVFLGLISMADDKGRLVDSVKQIDAFLFAYTDDTCRGSLDELSANGRIRRGMTASGQRIIQVINWHHQRIDKPNLAAALPEIADQSANNSEIDPGAGTGDVSADVVAVSVSTIGISDLRPVPGPVTGPRTGTGEQLPEPTRQPEPSPRLEGTAPAANGNSKCRFCDGRHGFHSPVCPTQVGSVAHA